MDLFTFLSMLSDDVKKELDKYNQENKAQYTPIAEVCHMAHFWVSYGRCTMPGSPMGRSEGLSRRWAG